MRESVVGLGRDFLLDSHAAKLYCLLAVGPDRQSPFRNNRPTVCKLYGVE